MVDELSDKKGIAPSLQKAGLPRASISLDELDLRLIKLLEAGPRQSHTSLAASLGISRTTVGQMLNRLVEARVIRTMCMADHVAMGYKYSVLFGLNVAPGKLLEAAEGLAAMTEIHDVTLCAGPFDITSWGIFRGPSDLVSFLTSAMARIEGLSRHETIICQELIISPSMLAEGQRFQSADRRASLDNLDLALVGELQRHGAESTASLAKKLGTSKPTVLRRIGRMIDEGVIRYITTVNPIALGYKGNAAVGLKVNPGSLREVAEAVAALRRVHTTAICTGRYDVIAWVIFRDQPDLIRILTTQIGKIPGIRSMETITNLRTIKTSYISLDGQADLWKSLKSASSQSNVSDQSVQHK